MVNKDYHLANKSFRGGNLQVNFAGSLLEAQVHTLQLQV